VHPKYPHVFSQISLGPVEIPNRFYFAPHGIGLAVGNEPTNDLPYYSAARIRGGCGLAIQSLHVHGKISGMVSPYPEENLASFRVMAEAVHHEGGKIFGELWYFWGAHGQWWPGSPPRPGLTPTATQQFHNYYGTHGLSRAELRAFIDAYRQSTSHLRQAGYDGIELHVAHGALLEQILSPYFNQRADEYGGSRENRLRLVFECLEATREAAGDRMAVGIRFNCDEMLPGGYGQSEAREILGEICRSGFVDFVDLDVAVEPNQYWLGMPSVFVERHPYQPYVEAIRDAAGSVPVLSVLGRLTSIAEAEAAIAAGVCDMAGAARALIAEPDLVRNARDGNEELSRTCIACNYCLAAGHAGDAGCAINPAAFRERMWGEESFGSVTATPSKVVVVGGGPGGLEAARVAALKGHQVVLFESTSELGGGLRVWATIPGREWFQKGVDWWARQVERLGLDVRLGTEATAEAVLAEQPDAVIIATGARYSLTGRSGFLNAEMPGHDRDFVLTPEDTLSGGQSPTGKVVLVDGEGIHTGVGIAEMLAGAGAQVELVAPGFAPVDANLFGTSEVGFIVGRLKAAGVTIAASTWVRSIGDRSVTLYDVFTDQERIIDDVSAVVLATAREPHDALTEALDGKVNQLFTIGDALAARSLAAASYEGQMFARFIGEPGAPRNFNDAYWPEPDRTQMPRPAAVLLEEPSLAGGA
jgi:2,4-dienoyl-CoA reductase-like NADH-dependent reductase (Old Yellow Enzyme family)/pyruvate/2-oxoglutarate dehydrogenase complex dihydrolipoamide dehydrogenase (E3) component